VLKHRVITAALLAPVVLGAILFLPSGTLALALGAFILMGAWEWAGLMGLPEWPRRLAYCAAMAAGLFLAYQMLGSSWRLVFLGGLGVLALLWWGAAFYWVANYERGGPGVPWTNYVLGAAGFLVLVPAWTFLVELHGQGGPQLVIALMLLVWAADIAAYFAGRAWGRRRLAARVSPGKSWEGVLAGLLATIFIGGAYSMTITSNHGMQALFAMLFGITAAFSVLGDLFESLVKRQAGVKDSGQLLPGHGGVLDRIDSLTAAAPVFTLGLYFLAGRLGS
jgi:phosphatidate cytidylyltransferase